jgi:hypothetical protein
MTADLGRIVLIAATGTTMNGIVEQVASVKNIVSPFEGTAVLPPDPRIV